MKVPYLPTKVEESKFKDRYRKKLSLDSGDFYIFDVFVIAEIKEGYHFDWSAAKTLIDQVYEHFGSNQVKLSYISNRINSYSVQPKDWLNFYKERHHVQCVAIVAYNKMGTMSVVLERIFSKASFRKFTNLDEAVAWAVVCSHEKVEN